MEQRAQVEQKRPVIWPPTSFPGQGLLDQGPKRDEAPDERGRVSGMHC